MTVRELIQTILSESPRLDADVYISKSLDDIECKSYVFEQITSEGSNDSIVIKIKDWNGMGSD